MKTEADIGVVAFPISVSALVYFYILKSKDHFRGAGVLSEPFDNPRSKGDATERQIARFNRSPTDSKVKSATNAYFAEYFSLPSRNLQVSFGVM